MLKSAVRQKVLARKVAKERIKNQLLLIKPLTRPKMHHQKQRKALHQKAREKVHTPLLDFA